MSFYAYEFRAYPTPEQAQKINQTIGCARKVYNLLLDDCQRQYEESGKFSIMNVGELKKREDLQYLREVDSMALCNSYMHLKASYTSFFRNLKKGKYTPPKFKAKRDSKQSYSTNNINNSIRIEHKGLRLPKLGTVKCKFHRFVEGTIKSVTVKRTKTGKYFFSILVDREDKIVERECDTDYENSVLGIDMSIPNFAVYSDNTKPKIIHYLRNSEEKLARAQKDLSRKQKDSRNWEKQRLKVARIHEKISNQRKNFIETESARIAKEFEAVVVEDIDLQAMSQCLHFGKSISDNGFGYFRTRLETKLNAQLKDFVKADRWYPSSKTCHVCGYVNKGLKLSDREWDCPSCGTHLDRDLNAAINLKNYYIRMQRTNLVETGSVDDKPNSPKKHPVEEARKVVSMDENPKSQAFCFS